MTVIALLAACLLGALPMSSAYAAVSLTVTKVADTNDGVCSATDCSLREAVIAANAVGDATITLQPLTYNLTINGAGEDNAATGDLDLKGTVTIGVSGGGTATVRGNRTDRIFQVHNTAAATMNDLIITGGSVSGSNAGGGILANGSLTVNNSRVNGNSANGNAGGIGVGLATLMLNNSTVSGNSAAGDGGGISSLLAVITINNSTISGNTANGNAGGIEISGDLKVSNSTISGNSAKADGGGIFNLGGSMTLRNITLVNNKADSDNNGSGKGGGLFNPSGATAKVQNSIIGNNSGQNTVALNCSGPITSEGFNLLDPQGCFSLSNNPTDVRAPSVNLELGPLRNNGGPTSTHALLPLNLAIDAGNPAGCVDAAGTALTADQRGQPRPIDGNGDGVVRCDIGAFEFAPPAPKTFTVDNHTLDLGDSNLGDGVCAAGTTAAQKCTLRAAIQETNARGTNDTIVVPPSIYLLTITGLNEDLAASGDLDITNPHFGGTTIVGGGAATTIVNGNSAFVKDRIFDIRPRARAHISGLAIQNGISSSDGGSAIRNSDNGHLTLSDVIVSDNQAFSDTSFAAILSTGFLTATATTVRDNSGDGIESRAQGARGIVLQNSLVANNTGTGVLVNGRASIGNTTIRNNRLGMFLALRGATSTITNSAIVDNLANPTNLSSGGIQVFNDSGSLTIANSTISGNINQTGQGGGLAVLDGAGVVNLNNVTITNNRSEGSLNSSGGGISLFRSTLNIKNSIVAGNFATANGPDCFSSGGQFATPITSQGHNLIGNGSGCNITLSTGDQVGSAASPIDAKLGPLQDNGGVTVTHALLQGSPAIDAGDPATPGSGGSACEATDQRGVARPLDGDQDGAAVCDSGAFES